MNIQTIFGILFVIALVDSKTVTTKSYSKPSINIQDTIEDVSSMSRDSKVKTTLNVALYPYIPDLDGDNHQNLLKYIKTEFEKRYQSVRLVLRPMSVFDPFYDVDELSKWLNSSGDTYDIVEVDTVLLGDLVDAGVAAPQYLQTSKPPVDWHPAVASAVTVNGEIYGYPHLLCTILLFTRNAQVAASATVDDLVRNINAAQPQYPYGLAGNLNSSWDTVSLYYDAYRENNFPYDNYYGAADEWSHDALKSLRKIAQLCTLHPNINECVNGYFNDNYDLPAKLFGIRQTQALYGYSERLFHVLKEAVAANYTNNQNTKIAPLPLGEIPNEPLFFTDAFVFRRGMSNDKLEAARNFVQFLATPKMQAAAVGAEETAKNKRLLRYLLPISSKAYDEPPLNTDYFYQTYFRNLTGRNVPNKGLNQRRQKAEPWLAAYLNRPF